LKAYSSGEEAQKLQTFEKQSSRLAGFVALKL